MPVRRDHRIGSRRSRSQSCGVVGGQIQSRRVTIERACAANALTPARPHGFVQLKMVLLSRPLRRNRRFNGHRVQISSRTAPDSLHVAIVSVGGSVNQGIKT
jgi:hypothetical protein